MANGAGHAGDVNSQQAMERLKADGSAVLVDVRTEGEWANVGVPDLSSVGGEPLFLQWIEAPTMLPNPAFADDLAAELERRGATAETPVFFLCRSGARSSAAASAMAARGYSQTYNVAGGFEGSPAAGLEGWRDSGLPWSRAGG